MDYFIFTKKIKIYSIFAVLLPIIAFSLCILLYSILGNYITYTFPKNIEWKNNQSTLYKWNWRKIENNKKNLFSFTNCYEVMIDKHVVLKNGNEFIDYNQKLLNDALKNDKVKGFYWKKTEIKNNSCIKNKPVIYTILKKYPKFDIFLSNIQQTYTRGFSEIKNPFLYGEVSISRTARYFPASLIFKPLIVLSAVCLIFYWLNNLKVFRLLRKDLSSKLYEKNNIFFIFGFLSAIFLILHSIFLGIENQSEIFKFFRKFIIIFFILFEVTAQILLTFSLYKNKTKLNKIINFTILKAKIVYVAIILFITIISVYILSFENPSTSFKNTLEWNYFIFLLFYYILSYFMWRKKT